MALGNRQTAQIGQRLHTDLKSTSTPPRMKRSEAAGGERGSGGAPAGERTHGNPVLESSEIKFWKVHPGCSVRRLEARRVKPLDRSERSTGCLVPLQCPSVQSDAVAGRD